MRLDGKIALVTGAGSGIGRALARELAGLGALVLLVGRRRDALEQTLASFPDPDFGVVLAADITDAASREVLVAEIAKRGRLDLLVNNAGLVEAGAARAEDTASRRRMVETNLLAPMELTLALLPWLEAAKPSRIVNVGSMFGDIGFPWFAAYSATKFGLRGWSEAMRRELEPRGVGITYAAPRGTRTGATDDRLAEAFEMRLDQPEAVAGAIVQAALKGARDIYPRGPERLFVLLQRLVPSVIDGALAGQFKRAVARLALVSGLAMLAAVPLAQAADGGVDALAPPRPLSSLESESGWYASGKGGPSQAKLHGIGATGSGSVDNSQASNIIGAFGMAAGYDWAKRTKLPLRTELEFMNRTEVTYDATPLMAGSSSGALASTVQNITTMGKAYWYFPGRSQIWAPFVSGGLGWSHNNVKSQYTPTGSGSTISNTHASDDLAWSGGVGASFKLGPKVMNDVEIRYVDLGRANWGMPASRNIAANGMGDFAAMEVSFAIRMMF